MSFYHGPTLVTNGLVLHLDAADRNSYPGSGTSWFDMSGNGYNGTLTNTPTYNTTNGGQIMMDGVDEYVVTPSFYNLAITNQITATIWCKSNTSTWNSTGFLMSKRDQFILHPIGGSKEFFVYVNTTSVGWESVYFTPSVEITEYNSFTLHYTSTILKIYLNGILITTNTGVGATLSNNSSQLFIGNDSNISNQRFFNGSVGSATVYNRALSDAEVLQNYNVQKSRFGL